MFEPHMCEMVLHVTTVQHKSTKQDGHVERINVLLIKYRLTSCAAYMCSCLKSVNHLIVFEH